MIRLPDDTFAYIVDEPIWADKSRQNLDDIMRQVAMALERVIRQHSEQWFLFHDLWDIESDRGAGHRDRLRHVRERSLWRPILKKVSRRQDKTGA